MNPSTIAAMPKSLMQDVVPPYAKFMQRPVAMTAQVSAKAPSAAKPQPAIISEIKAPAPAAKPVENPVKIESIPVAQPPTDHTAHYIAPAAAVEAAAPVEIAIPTDHQAHPMETDHQHMVQAHQPKPYLAITLAIVMGLILSALAVSLYTRQG